MNKKLLKNRSIYETKLLSLRFQFHIPKWCFLDNDYYLMMPTVLRYFVDKRKELTDYGAGIVILGFGMAIYYTHNKGQ